MPRIVGVKDGSIESGREFPATAGAVTVDRHRITYQVLADNIDQTWLDIIATPGLPQQGQSFGNMGLRRLIPREMRGQALLWEVDAEWDSRVDGSEDSPLSPKARWSSIRLELPLTHDQVTGAPIENSIGDPFFPTGPVPVSVRTVSRLEDKSIDTYDALQQNFVGRINSTEFRGWPPYTVLVEAIDAEEEVMGRKTYVRVTYVTHHLLRMVPVTVKPMRTFAQNGTTPQTTLIPLGWRLSLLNQAQQYFKDPSAATKTLVNFRDLHGNMVMGNLALDGGALAADADPIWLRWFAHRLCDINELVI